MKAYIESYGCSASQAEGFAIKKILSDSFSVTDNATDATIMIINTCAVKEQTETKMFRRISELNEIRKKNGGILIVSGCLPKIQADKILEIDSEIKMVGPREINKIGELLGLDEKLDEFIGPEQEQISGNDIIDIVPISIGCLGNCSYCATKIARGSLSSFSVKDIVNRVKKSVLAEGKKEIWLTSQDTAVYGKDIKLNLAKLLTEITKIKGAFKIRVGMMNPFAIVDYLDEFLDVFTHEKIFKFLHIPVQSGNDEVLKNMNRMYTAREFALLIEKIREKVPDVTIATDFIVGFPEESIEQFEDSIKLMEEINPDVINISRFGVRKGTAAEKMKDMVSREKTNRSRKMTAIAKEIKKKRNLELIEREFEIFIDETGQAGSMIGRNDYYKPVVVKGIGKEMLGKKMYVKIVDANINYCVGETIEK